MDGEFDNGVALSSGSETIFGALPTRANELQVVHGGSPQNHAAISQSVFDFGLRLYCAMHTTSSTYHARIDYGSEPVATAV